MPTLKGWKTLGFAAFVSIVGFLETVNWVDVVPPEHQGPAMIGIGIVMAVLRVVTTTPVGGK